jgi:hypothetical protein
LVEGGILVVCVSWGWLRGTGPALAGIARKEGLSRCWIGVSVLVGKELLQNTDQVV